jgi:hypothetical protein
MTSRLLAPAAALAALAAAGCSWLEDDPPPTPNPNAPRLVGRIASIPPDRKFVLIESYGKWTVPAGAILTVHGPDNRSANLIATGEVLRRHAAADIQSGTLEVGDGVYTTAPPVAEPSSSAPDQAATPPADPPDAKPPPPQAP